MIFFIIKILLPNLIIQLGNSIKAIEFPRIFKFFIETKFNRIDAALVAECNPQSDFFTNFTLSKGYKEGV